ncbi:hypothetical protein SFRURICE_011857 [Spodoptera frugiperda]|nr:hypothetical protein SFRURICE_011857 [Spodoptera frugiperda]
MLNWRPTWGFRPCRELGTSIYNVLCARHPARAAIDADNQPSHVSDRDVYDEATEQSPADTNTCLIETLQSLPNAGASWQSPLPSSPSLNTTTSSSGNFAKCTARFTGTSQESEVLEAFIDAVQVHKECADVSDDHALRGLPMLLEGDATVWWRSARSNVATWKDTVLRLRSMYGTPKPAYKILREMFS